MVSLPPSPPGYSWTGRNTVGGRHRPLQKGAAGWHGGLLRRAGIFRPKVQLQHRRIVRREPSGGGASRTQAPARPQGYRRARRTSAPRGNPGRVRTRAISARLHAAGGFDAATRRTLDYTHSNTSGILYAPRPAAQARSSGSAPPVKNALRAYPVHPARRRLFFPRGEAANTKPPAGLPPAAAFSLYLFACIPYCEHAVIVASQSIGNLVQFSFGEIVPS